MAIIPTYDSTGRLNTGAMGVKADPAKESQGGRNIASVGKALQEVNNKWQEARDFNEKLDFKTDRETKIRDIEQRAKQEPDYKASGTYQAELDALTNIEEGAFSNNIARMESAAFIKGQVGVAKARINGLFRGKEVVHGQANIKKDLRLARQLYVEGNLAKIAEARGVLATGKEKGYIDELYVEDQTAKMNDWDFDRALYDATVGDAYDVIKAVNEEDSPYMIQKGKKADLVSKLKSIAEIKSKEEDIELLRTQHQTKTEYIEGEDQRSLQENLVLLEEGESMKTMNKDWVEHKRAALLSPKGINATTQNSYFAEVADKINEAEAAYAFYEDAKSATDYYTALQDAEIAVEVGRKNGLLDDGAYKILTNRIYTKSAAQARYDVNDHLDQAIKYFRTEMEDKKDQDAAIKEYLYRVADKKPENLDMDKILGSIKNNYLKSKDPTYNAERYKNVRNVRLIKVGTTVINPLTMEQKILDKNGEWVTIQ
jgi:hypothetical protein